MTYLFDTNICIYLLERQDSALVRRVSSLPPLSVAVSTLTVAEIQDGIARRVDADSAFGVQAEFLSSFVVIPFDARDAEAFGRMATIQRGRPRRSQIVDRLLAAQAMARGLTIITNDRSFPRGPGVPVLTWTR